jgi:N utilization substance protein A
LRVYVAEVNDTPRGPQIIVSRAHRFMLRRLFEQEVPEIYNGVVEIKAIAREAGARSKVAVAARQPGIDPVGSCVGMRGVRIQNIVNELGGEKIDVVEWSDETPRYVANALSPAQVTEVLINEDERTATVIVPERQLSLAIGKEGQNARLAAKLTGWRIDIKSDVAWTAEQESSMGAAEPVVDGAADDSSADGTTATTADGSADSTAVGTTDGAAVDKGVAVASDS